jgi:AmmeMemoRadiSam system protein A
MKFSAEECRLLFDIARETISATLDGRRFEISLPDAPHLRQPSGVFVTLNLNDELRGCIGCVLPEQPLYLAVAQNAFNAAFRDPRFPPLTRAELEEIEVEISVMTIPEPVSDFRQIEVGRDGLIVRKGGAVGLLLPQVATEYGWDREQFLSYTCAKAGLAPRAWQDETCRVEKFTAEVLSELPAGA